jgi:diacylglycerol kinase
MPAALALLVGLWLSHDNVDRLLLLFVIVALLIVEHLP